MFHKAIISRVNQFFKKYLGDNVLLGNNWARFKKSQLGGKNI